MSITSWDCLLSNQFIDVWLRAGDELIGAHKVVIANKSSYMYNEYLTKHTIVDLFNVTVPVCKAYLAVLYDVHSEHQQRSVKLTTVEQDLELLNLIHNTKVNSVIWTTLLGVLYGVIPSFYFIQYYKTLSKHNMNHGLAMSTLLWPNITEDTNILGIGYAHIEELLRNYPKEYKETLRYKIVCNVVRDGLHHNLFQYVKFDEYNGSISDDAAKYLLFKK